MREQADAAIEGGEVEPLVIVGIYNTGDRRLAEYTHEHNWQMGGGEADAYGKLLTKELMPWIADKYRVRQDRESTGMGGSSLGGLVSLYLGLRHPEVFGRLALLSPSVWWNHKSILGYLNEHDDGVAPRRVELIPVCGDEESNTAGEEDPSEDEGDSSLPPQPGGALLLRFIGPDAGSGIAVEDTGGLPAI